MLHLFFAFFWLISILKTKLFWLYLWQLKNYHTGRFVDHFRTHKGRSILLNPVFIFKLLFLLALPFLPMLLGAIVLIYILESANAIRHAFKGNLLKPTITKKTLFLTVAGFILIAAFAFVLLENGIELTSFAFWLTLFDVAAPAVFSSLVLLLQPLTILMRGRILAAAKKKRQAHSNLTVIGITGSYGKTTTKEFLSYILSTKFKVLKTKDHQNSEVGISQSILEELKKDHEVFVCEMGAYSKGGVKLLADIAKPHGAIILGANEQHLAIFGSMEHLLSAEGGKELLLSLPQDGFAIFNGHNTFAKSLYEHAQLQKRILSGKDIKAEHVKVEKESISFDLVYGGERFSITVNLLGGYNTENLLLAIATAKELGMSLEEIVQAVATIPQELGAMKLYGGKSGLSIIDSTYSANPDGVIAALEYLKVWPSKKVIVMPSLIELGKASKEVHKRIGKKIAEVCDLAIITTRDHFEDLKGSSNSVLFIENPHQIAEKIRTFLQKNLDSSQGSELKSTTNPGDVVLLEGRVPNGLTSLLQGDVQKPAGIRP